MRGFLGGHPVRVAIRLILLSLVVGWLLRWLDLGARDVGLWAIDLLRDTADLAVGAFGRFGDTILLGAAVVVPIFLVSRLIGSRRRS